MSTDSLHSFQPDLSTLYQLIGSDPEDVRMYMNASRKDVITIYENVEIAHQTLDANKLGKAIHQLNTMMKMYGQTHIADWEKEAKTAYAKGDHIIFRKKTQCILNLLRQWLLWLDAKLE